MNQQLEETINSFMNANTNKTKWNNDMDKFGSSFTVCGNFVGNLSFIQYGNNPISRNLQQL